MSLRKQSSRHSMGKLTEGQQWGLRNGRSLVSSSGGLVSRAAKSQRTCEVTHQQECKMNETFTNKLCNQNVLSSEIAKRRGLWGKMYSWILGVKDRNHFNLNILNYVTWNNIFGDKFVMSEHFKRSSLWPRISTLYLDCILHWRKSADTFRLFFVCQASFTRIYLCIEDLCLSCLIEIFC